MADPTEDDLRRLGEGLGLRGAFPTITDDDQVRIRGVSIETDGGHPGTWIRDRVGDGEVPLGPLAADLLANPGKSIPDLLSRTDEDPDRGPGAARGDVDVAPVFGPGSDNVHVLPRDQAMPPEALRVVQSP